MKINSIIAVALLCLSTQPAFSQWSNANPTVTGNKVLINNVIAGASTPGSPPPPPVLRVMTTDNSFTPSQTRYHLNIADNGAIGFGTVTPAQMFHVSYPAYFSDKIGIGVAVPAAKPFTFLRRIIESSSRKIG